VSDDEDAELLRAAADGDRGAMDQLVRRHQGTVWRAVRGRTASEALAEEVFQDTFLTAWRNADRWRGEGSVRNWLLGMARRKAAHTWRRRVGEPAEHEPLHELGLAAGWGADPEAAASAAEDREALLRALAMLSETDQTILGLCDLEGHSGPEAAQLLGLTANAARVRLHRARLRLMAVLREGDHGR